jgi:hypothetical protein
MMERDADLVQEELHRRIETIRTEEATDPERRALTNRELLVYVGTTVLLCLIGILVMAL